MIDVLIAGGGVAGCAAAIGLANQGFNVAVLQSGERREHAGEMLGPSIRAPLTELRVWDRFLADDHPRCHGMYSAWGSPELYSNDFVFHPHGSGWHIDRSRFDRMLADAAREAGAVFHADTVPVGIEETDAGWNVSVRTADSPLALKARFLVDATGRSAFVARKMGAHRIRLDRGVAVTRRYQFPPGQAADSFTLVEASPDGWWYSALLPSNQMAVQVFTDPEFRLQAEPPPHTAARLRGSSCVTGAQVCSAGSSYLDRAAGRRWLALGDAASTWDPLSAQGIAKALKSALSAAAAIPRLFAGDSNAISDFAQEARNLFTKYSQARQHYYRREQRWSASLFWQRRQLLDRSAGGGLEAPE